MEALLPLLARTALVAFASGTARAAGNQVGKAGGSYIASWIPDGQPRDTGQRQFMSTVNGQQNSQQNNSAGYGVLQPPQVFQATQRIDPAFTGGMRY